MARLHLIPMLALLAAACGNEPADRSAPTGNAAAPDAAKPTLSLSRLDCGALEVKNFDSFSDRPGLYGGKPRTLTDSCYLIRHGDQRMLWDTGFSDEIIGQPVVQPEQTASLDRSLVDQLKAGGITPDQIGWVGISHFHADHTGQAPRFANATLLMGKADLTALRQEKEAGPFFRMAQQQLSHWLSGKGKVEEVSGDKDVFGDGSVVMLDLPGHTPGHHGLLVNLTSGPVLLSGDLYHASLAREKRGVPPFNTDRAQTLRSMDRFEALAGKTGAKVVIQHEVADIAKVPAFPDAAE